MAEIFFCTGGCRSGKSVQALRWAEGRSATRVFLATAQPDDEEMLERVRRHQSERGPSWVTLELPMPEALALPDYLRRAAGLGGVILLDCLGMWAAACMELCRDDAPILDCFASGLEVLRSLPVPAALVSNEVGLGLVPEHRSGRRFRDLLGLLNQRAARSADHAALMVSGLPMVLKGKI